MLLQVLLRVILLLLLLLTAVVTVLGPFKRAGKSIILYIDFDHFSFAKRNYSSDCKLPKKGSGVRPQVYCGLRTRRIMIYFFPRSLPVTVSVDLDTSIGELTVTAIEPPPSSRAKT
jgi:hypothetical protein